MKLSQLFVYLVLSLVGVLLLIFTFIHGDEDEAASSSAGFTVMDKLKSLRSGKSLLSQVQNAQERRDTLTSIPHLFSIPMFQHLADANQSGGGSIPLAPAPAAASAAAVETDKKVSTKGSKGSNDIHATTVPGSHATRTSGSKLRSALFHGTDSGDGGSIMTTAMTTATTTSSRSSSNKMKEMNNKSMKEQAIPRHPAAPDPRLEPMPTEKPMACRQSYEPSCPMYPYVRFWNARFYPEDCYQSPFRHPLGQEAPVEELKYLVFEPDRGGWNNIRMAAETAMIFAHTTGRVLVMPPAAKMYLLHHNKNDEENQSTFSKFFDLSKLAESITIITMEEFLQKVAVPGHLSVPFPAKWAGRVNEFVKVQRDDERLWKYLEASCYTREWEPGKIHLGFNLTHDAAGDPLFGKFDWKDPRIKRHASHARKLVPYDAKMHVHKAIYFPGDYRNTHRILTHFYSYLYWADLHVEHIYKRLVRDRLHYHDDIFCAAGRVVRMLQEDAAALSQGRFRAPSASNADLLTLGGDSNKDATYFAYHIRRGDFQYKHTKISAQEIWDNTKHLLDNNRTSVIYVATDESNKEFFEPFHRGSENHNFKVVFLADYIKRAMLGDSHLNQNHIGMVEQVICANAHTFIGKKCCRIFTFTLDFAHFQCFLSIMLNNPHYNL